MNTITFQVTQEDIDLGKKGQSSECAIALALQRELGHYDLCVASTSIMIKGKRYKTSEEVETFVRNFDRDKVLVFPAEFLVDVSTPLKLNDHLLELSGVLVSA